MNSAVLKALKKHDHVLYQAPTGFGKSICILDLVQKYMIAGKRVLVIAPRRKLVKQLSETFKYENPAILMGSDTKGDASRSDLIIASLQTLHSRLKKNINLLGDIDYIIIDEAHISFNIKDNKPQTVVSLLYSRYWSGANCKWIGFTATPITANGYRLEGWDKTVSKYNTQWLIKKGWLARFDYLSIDSIDASHLKIDKMTGDFSASDIDEVSTSPAAINSVVEAYKKHCVGTKTLIFAASITHAEILLEAFKKDKDDISASMIHSNLPYKEQDSVLTSFKNNDVNLLINVGILTTGFDDPEVESLIIARPIGSLRLAIQVWGRALRPHDDIPKVKIVDLCGVYDIVDCLPNDNINWNRTKASQPVKDDKKDDKNITSVIVQCPTCKTESRMIDCKRIQETTSTFISTIWLCPECEDVVKESSTDLVESEVKKIKTIDDLDLKKSYTQEEYLNALGELIKLNTQGAKTSWGYYIMKDCIAYNKREFLISMKAYMQKIYSYKKAWKRIMEVYSDANSNEIIEA